MEELTLEKLDIEFIKRLFTEHIERYHGGRYNNIQCPRCKDWTHQLMKSNICIVCYSQDCQEEAMARHVEAQW